MNALKYRFTPFARCGVILLFATSVASAQIGTVLGTGTSALLGGDLTDPDDNGAADADENYNAVFRANDEEGFGGGEFAFNVFDNRLGPGNDKWCCGVAGGFPEEGLWVEAELKSPPAFLTHFTVSSANDVPGRDPLVWSVSGSNDGENYDTIFETDGEVIWDERLQVIRFNAGDDFPQQETAYQIFRMTTFDSENNPNGAYFQIGEIEFFGSFVEELTGDYNGDGTVDLLDFTILAGNFRNTGTTFADGDGNRDGTVDLHDFVEFRAAFNAQGGAAAASVPEPSGLALVAFGLGLVLWRRRKPRR